MKCPKCEAEVDDQALFCPQCGVRLAGEPEPSEAPSAGPDPNAPPRERFLAAAAEKQTGPDEDDAEDDLWEGSYDKMAMLGTWITGAALTIGVPVAGLLGGLPGGYWKWVVLGVLFMWGVLIGLYFYRRLSVHYTLTSQRLVHESGLLWRQTDRVELIDIDDVTFRQDPVQRMIGIGTIVVSSSDRTDPELKLLGIASARSVADTIDDARRRERRRRGLHIESV